jgi:competence protein CoiA
MPLLALVDGRPEQASPGQAGLCPACDAPMVAKCGRIITWHWAHAGGESCDPWRQGETQWHLDWKQRFLAAGARIEVRIERNGVMHIADVVGGPPNAEFVLELAGVYPPADQIAKREAFYGRMAWLYNSDRFIDRLELYNKAGELRFRWKQPVKSMELHRRPVFWELAARDEDHTADDLVARLLWVKRFYDSYREAHRTYGAVAGKGTAAAFVESVMTTGVL